MPQEQALLQEMIDNLEVGAPAFAGRILSPPAGIWQMQARSSREPAGTVILSEFNESNSNS